MLQGYVRRYTRCLLPSVLGSKTPLQAMKDWHKLKPELFKKRPYFRDVTSKLTALNEV